MLIDTNIAILLRDGDERTIARLDLTELPVAISLVTLIELRGSIHQDRDIIVKRQVGVSSLLKRVDILKLDEPVVDAYAQIIMAVGFSRRRILDRLIAATSIVHDLTLATMNGNDFYDIPDLHLEVWPSPQ